VKSGTIDHPKMLNLQARLGIPLNHAVGIMEHLWHWAGRYAPRGDIGKWSDEQIQQAIAPELKRDLIPALIDSKWVDRVSDSAGRLLLHDWSDHCEQRVRKFLLRTGEEFAKSPDGVRTDSGQSPDGVRTDSGQSPDGVQPRARAPEPEPVPAPTPVPVPGCPDTLSLPDSPEAFFKSIREIHPNYRTVTQPQADLAWMDTTRYLQSRPEAARALSKAWMTFVRKSAEKPFPRPCTTWTSFMEEELARLPEAAPGVASRRVEILDTGTDDEHAARRNLLAVQAGQRLKKKKTGAASAAAGDKDKKTGRNEA
jgi:hypothetical protein